MGEYESSSTCQRLFCKQCGASVVNIDKAADADEWEVATGVLHFDDGNGLGSRLNRAQMWVEDVRGDGGTTGWINQGRLEGMDRHWRGRKSEVVTDEDVWQMMRQGQEFSAELPGEHLDASCHCQNVAFSMSRPEKSFNNGTGKFEASLDACTSCRTVGGFEITSWITVPKELIKSGSGHLGTLLANRSKLGHYNTSSDVSRYFCTTCGATVFYEKHGHDTIDIGIGLLHPQHEGAMRVENWLAWQEYPKCLGYQEDAVDKHFVANLAEGMRLAEVSRKGTKVDKQV
ncbi:hypothetical protein LTR06_005230 [Exophiala xenobiotica]|nr:hypothetical protein LTR06_005230 [Exophiala xenobiotica]